MVILHLSVLTVDCPDGVLLRLDDQLNFLIVSDCVVKLFYFLTQLLKILIIFLEPRFIQGNLFCKFMEESFDFDR
jgi:hypothetical protein